MMSLPGHAPHLHLHHVDGVPAALDLLGAVAGLLDEDDAGEAVIQIPQVDGGNPALKIPVGGAERQAGRRPMAARQRGACTHRSLYWSKALLASTSSLRRRADGMAPSSIGGSYLLLQGDLTHTGAHDTQTAATFTTFKVMLVIKKHV